ncbi:MAG: bifunctional diaminohydroxyphosphoribosylaminopyrimidine deaminase/5-amino-6-(5-phosphoribosylamino)uracil reductase RibD [Planctomycetota bacterium]
MTGDFTAAEHDHMRRALHLARRGQGRVEPNPMVGCVLAKRGRIIAEGYHRSYGGPHAEVEALRGAGRAARGATVFVTLEPCCHYGKTPPCTEALIEAGVGRVVVAMADPFPAVAGKGIAQLRQAGIPVEVGLLEAQARELNAPFITLVTRRRPYTILKWAQSLDGRIATRTGDSRWISSPASRRLVHRLRARVDGVVVGVGTVLADDPQLTARDVPLRRTASRIVLDSRLRVPPEATLVTTAHQTPTLILTTNEAVLSQPDKADRLLCSGAEIVVCRARNGHVDLRSALRKLGRRRLTSLLVEGGGCVLGAFLDLKLADEAMIFVSPRFIGGDDAVGPHRGKGVARAAGAPLHTPYRIARVGCDVLYRIRFGDPRPSASAPFDPA